MRPGRCPPRSWATPTACGWDSGGAGRPGCRGPAFWRGAPADTAGMRAGDVIVEFARAPVKEVPDLQRHAADAAPGKPVQLVVVRDGARVPVTVTVAEMPAEEPATAVSSGDERWGLSVEPLGSDAARRLPPSQGVVVTDVAAGGPA